MLKVTILWCLFLFLVLLLCQLFAKIKTLIGEIQMTFDYDVLCYVQYAANMGDLDEFMKMYYLIKEQEPTLTINEFVAAANISRESFLRLIKSNESVSTDEIKNESLIVLGSIQIKDESDKISSDKQPVL